MCKFKVGDKVWCKDAGTNWNIKNGQEYVISRVLNEGTIMLEGIGIEYMSFRFELMVEPKSNNPCIREPILKKTVQEGMLIFGQNSLKVIPLADGRTLLVNVGTFNKKQLTELGRSLSEIAEVME